MARKPAEAINLLRKAPQFARFDDSSFAAEVADQALKLMWDEYDWRESLATLPPFYMTPNEADAIVGTVVPTDFLRLVRAWLRNIPDEIHELGVVNSLTPASVSGQPELISYLPETGGFRLHPRPGPGYGAPLWQVEGVYKIAATTITGSTLEDTPLPWDDRFFEAYKQCLKYVYMDTLGAQGAGEGVYQNGYIQYTGQLGKYKSCLWDAIERENLQRGASYRAPTDSLMLG